MEVSVIGSSQAKIGRGEPDVELWSYLSRRILISPRSNLCFGRSTGWRQRPSIRLAIKATAHSEPIVLDKSSLAYISKPGISIGLGPNGELRYPSHRHATKNKNLHGVGEFQCYDETMLNNLKKYAEASGNHTWGLSGSHDAPNYDSTPNSDTFVKEHGLSYGDFFLSWYSSQLISHGDRLLSLATSAFSDSNVEVSGKLPLIHTWYKTRSHPYVLTSGYYNTVNRDAYEEVVHVFARNSCALILPGMDLSDDRQPNEALSSPEAIRAQIITACKRHGVKILGQNSSFARNGFEHIKENLLDESKGVKLFTYQRIGAYFFSPEHFPLLTKFVRSFNQMVLELDDSSRDERVERSESLHKKDKHLEMQDA